MAARSEELYLGRNRPAPRYSRRQVEARRRILASTMVVLFSVMLFMLATGPEGSVLASRDKAPKAITLAPGQTLWDVAERYAAPGQDLRAYVDTLMQINQIEGLPQVDQRIRLPR